MTSSFGREPTLLLKWDVNTEFVLLTFRCVLGWFSNGSTVCAVFLRPHGHAQRFVCRQTHSTIMKTTEHKTAPPTAANRVDFLTLSFFDGDSVVVVVIVGLRNDEPENLPPKN